VSQSGKYITSSGPGGFIQTLTGNTGGAISPTAGNINIITANSTPKFVGAVSTETLDFGLTNLMLGASGASITTASQNVSYGLASLTAITSGTNNAVFGWNAGQSLTTGFGNIAIGSLAGNSWDATTGNNIAIGSPGAAGEIATTRIGANGTIIAAYIAGIDGINVGSTAKVVTMGTGATADKLGTATITAGAGISVTPGANAITIAAIGAGSFVWTIITADQTAAVNHGYFCNKAGTLALTLPVASAIGDVIEVANINTALGIQFIQAAGQQIFIGNTNTTLGATGTLTSIAVGDTLKIVCRTANLTWQVVSGWGNWTPA
jgi:hypothetical protein